MPLDIVTSNYQLLGLERINVVLGKNGCGKSTLLKSIEASSAGDNIGNIKYVTPERGGALAYDPGIENNISLNPEWMKGTRRVNQFQQFKQQSVAQFRRLEISVLRESESKKEVGNFQPYVERINGLLDNIEIRRADPAFDLRSKPGDVKLNPPDISSGESELISLGIEILMFSRELDPGTTNLLLLDEPDVHLHPDLQGRLIRFIRDLVEEGEFNVVIATHSTAILGGLSDYAEAAVAFMEVGKTTINFEAITDVHRRILPVFGAHPLSNVFNEAPALIVEGEDDERLWQQAVRTSEGEIALYPVPCEGVSSMNLYEEDVRRIISCVYENAKAYSLRDGDGVEEPIDDLPPITRIRLSCRSAENLILADEVLASEGLDWAEVVARMNHWLDTNQDHVKLDEMVAFRDGGFDRKGHDLKELRMLLVGAIIVSTKPWEVLVGQLLGNLVIPVGADAQDGSISEFLGPKAVELLVRHE